MNRIDRLAAILLQLQSKHIVRGKEIAERFGISLRTVYRDIRALEDAGVPIGSEVGLGYFLAEGFHLPPVMFTTQEASSLLLAGKLIEKFSDMSVNRNFSVAMDKIKAVMDNKEKDHLNTLSSYIEVLKTAPKTKNGFPNNLLADIQAVLGRRCLIRIEYTSGYKEETTRRIIEPLGLCFYGGAWHLLAYCRLRQDYRDFRVDRLKHVTATQTKFDDSRHGALKDLVDRMVYSADLKPACVRFDQAAARFARDQKYYFGFVEQKDHNSQIEMHFLTASYEGIARWLLSFVDAVEVISPDPLKAIIRKHACRLCDHHQG
jgi:predicted DNA-binding transcriptional regulator YafY